MLIALHDADAEHLHTASKFPNYALMTEDRIRIRMTQKVRGFVFAPPATFLQIGEEYEAKSNRNGAISGLCANGEWLGVKRGEFEFIEAPEWVLKIWGEAK